MDAAHSSPFKNPTLAFIPSSPPADDSAAHSAFGDSNTQFIDHLHPARESYRPPASLKAADESSGGQMQILTAIIVGVRVQLF